MQKKSSHSCVGCCCGVSTSLLGSQSLSHWVLLSVVWQGIVVVAPQRHAMSSFLVWGETLGPSVFFGIVTQPLFPSLLALNLSTKLVLCPLASPWREWAWVSELDTAWGCNYGPSFFWYGVTSAPGSWFLVLGQCLAVLLLPRQPQWSVSL